MMKADRPMGVHCKAGVGRTGTMIGSYIIIKYKMRAMTAMAWMRLCRPGMVSTVQQDFLLGVEHDNLGADPRESLTTRDTALLGEKTNVKRENSSQQLLLSYQQNFLTASDQNQRISMTSSKTYSQIQNKEYSPAGSKGSHQQMMMMSQGHNHQGGSPSKFIQIANELTINKSPSDKNFEIKEMKFNQQIDNISYQDPSLRASNQRGGSMVGPEIYTGNNTLISKEDAAAIVGQSINMHNGSLRNSMTMEQGATNASAKNRSISQSYVRQTTQPNKRGDSNSIIKSFVVPRKDKSRTAFSPRIRELNFSSTKNQRNKPFNVIGSTQFESLPNSQQNTGREIGSFRGRVTDFVQRVNSNSAVSLKTYNPSNNRNFNTQEDIHIQNSNYASPLTRGLKTRNTVNIEDSMRNTVHLTNTTPQNLVKAFDIRSGSPLIDTRRHHQTMDSMKNSFVDDIALQSQNPVQPKGKAVINSPPVTNQPFAFKQSNYNSAVMHKPSEMIKDSASQYSTPQHILGGRDSNSYNKIQTQRSGVQQKALLQFTKPPIQNAVKQNRLNSLKIQKRDQTFKGIDQKQLQSMYYMGPKKNSKNQNSFHHQHEQRSNLNLKKQPILNLSLRQNLKMNPSKNQSNILLKNITNNKNSIDGNNANGSFRNQQISIHGKPNPQQHRSKVFEMRQGGHGLQNRQIIGDTSRGNLNQSSSKQQGSQSRNVLGAVIGKRKNGKGGLFMRGRSTQQNVQGQRYSPLQQIKNQNRTVLVTQNSRRAIGQKAEQIQIQSNPINIAQNTRTSAVPTLRQRQGQIFGQAGHTRSDSYNNNQPRYVEQNGPTPNNQFYSSGLDQQRAQLNKFIYKSDSTIGNRPSIQPGISQRMRGQPKNNSFLQNQFIQTQQQQQMKYQEKQKFKDNSKRVNSIKIGASQSSTGKSNVLKLNYFVHGNGPAQGLRSRNNRQIRNEGRKVTNSFF